MAYRVLAVDDEPAILELIAHALTQSGFEVLTASTGQDARRLFTASSPDLVVLDLMLPDADGMDLCREIHRLSPTPVIVLSAKNTDVDKIIGLELGADDYMGKPFSPHELAARVKATLRRSHAVDSQQTFRQPNVLKMGSINLDLAQHRVLIDGEPVLLRLKEFQLLAYLMAHPNRVLSRDRILLDVWGYDVGVGRTIDVHIRRLRQKLHGDALTGPLRPLDIPCIQTVRGVGYRLSPPAAQEDHN